MRFAGLDLSEHGERLLGRGIGYCQRTLRFTEGQTALDYAMVGLLAQWISPAKARARALDALERAGAEHCAPLRQSQLTSAEAVRVALARTLALKPRLLAIDEPCKGVELRDRDGISRCCAHSPTRGSPYCRAPASRPASPRPTAY